MLGNPEVVIIDVRTGLDRTKGDVRIKGAVRENPGEDVHIWAPKYPKDKTIVLYGA
jgi:rhodanese-related sulfurtransferase